ncbi:MAG: hypothetical protein H7268_13815, partial [Sandarakinorhabdus sp.]|nr:hypothetical protein [Sandarakinorhabdus sp.]
ATVAECKAVRETVGLFDQSSFAKFRLEGRDAMRVLNRVCANDVDVALQPVEIACFGFCAGGDQEGRRAQPRHRQVRLDAAYFIQPLRIDQLTRRHVDIVGAHKVEHAHGVAAFQPELGKARLVEKPDGFADRLAFGRSRIEPILPAIAVFIFRLATRRRIPVRPFPAIGLAVAGAGCLQAVVQGGFAHPARCLILLERPVRRVQQPQAFADPFAQIFAVDLERHVAADIDRPKVGGRDAVADPFGHHLADAAGRLQPDGIQPGGDETPRQFGAFAQVIAHIRGKAFGSAEEFLDAGIFQRRDAAHRIHQHRFEVREIAGDLVKAKVFGNAVHAPGPGVRFKGTDQQFAGIIFVIAAIIIIAQHRQVGRQASNPFEQHIIMLAGVQRRRNADAGGEVTRPHAAAQHDIIGVDRPVRSFHPGDSGAIVANARHLGVFKNPHAIGAGTLGQRLGDIDRIGITVAGDVDAADNVIDLGDGEAFLDLLRGNHMHRQVEHLGHRSAALQLLEAFKVARHRNRSALAIPGGLAGFRLQPAVKLAGIFRQLGHVDRRAQLADQPGGMPGRATGQ